MRHQYCTDARSMLGTTADHARAYLATECADRSIRSRLLAFYVHCRAARDFGTYGEVFAEFYSVADDAGLVQQLGSDDDLNVTHLIACALRGESPFV